MQKSLNEWSNNGSKFILVAIDETEFWRDDIKRKAGKIEGVYLVNLREPTNLCELQISFPFTFTRNFVHNTEQFTEDELTTIELGIDDDNDIQYYPGTSIFKPLKRYTTGTLDDAIEKEKTNPTYC